MSQPPAPVHIPSATPEPIWFVPRPDDFHWRQWGQEIVLYHNASGDTHLLNPLAAEILKVIIEGPGDPAAIAARVAQRLDLQCDEELIRLIKQTLAQFDERGLIEPMSHSPGFSRGSDDR